MSIKTTMSKLYSNVETTLNQWWLQRGPDDLRRLYPGRSIFMSFHSLVNKLENVLRSSIRPFQAVCRLHCLVCGILAGKKHLNHCCNKTAHHSSIFRGVPLLKHQWMWVIGWNLWFRKSTLCKGKHRPCCPMHLLQHFLFLEMKWQSGHTHTSHTLVRNHTRTSFIF